MGSGGRGTGWEASRAAAPESSAAAADLRGSSARGEGERSRQIDGHRTGGGGGTGGKGEDSGMTLGF